LKARSGIESILAAAKAPGRIPAIISKPVPPAKPPIPAAANPPTKSVRFNDNPVSEARTIDTVANAPISTQKPVKGILKPVKPVVPPPPAPPAAPEPHDPKPAAPEPPVIPEPPNRK
jgi:hypothetical protein